MMAELEVDQSNLPRVQEVCQCFAVLEDGALAHNLQEQEIEQYYTSNVQRNQLVQKDIRVAKRLQDEEKHTSQLLQQQTTRQLEERDSEYARMIQEEIQRCAEEARRREVEDEEIAKRIQEEEELCVRRKGSYQNRDDRDISSVPVPPYSPRHVHALEDRYYERTSRRWQRSPSPPYSNYEDSQSRPTVTNRTQASHNCRSTTGQRMPVSNGRPSRSHSDQDNRSTTSGSSVTQKSRTSHLSGGWGDVIKLIRNDMSEQGYLSPSSEDELFEPVYKLERILKQNQQVSDQSGDRGARLSRHSRTRQGDGCGRQESFRERDRERHVHFLDERRRGNGYHGNGYSLHENGHIDFRERHSLSAGKLRDPRESVGDQRQTQAPGFHRNISMRRSYHGDVRLSRRTSVCGESRTASQDDSNVVNRVSNAQLMETEVRRPGPLREAGRWEAARNQRQRARSLTEERMNDRDHRRYPRQHRIRRSQSERWQSLEEERSSTEEEMESRRDVRWMERLPSRSTRQSRSGHSSRAGPAGRSGTTALDLGELEQVLLDEEMARRLQEEEARLATETQQESSPLRGVCPEDFRMAQVAQDEEIARFIQKQEIKAKRRSAELDSAGSRREYRDTVTEYDRRVVCDRQRERMGSDGLQSPVDDFTTDHQLSSPVSMATPPTRNIAEDLDPTFHRKEINGAGQNQGPQHVGSYNPIEEQSTFVPPTKRQNDKPGPKSKEKKENIKQKENCKQQ